MISIFFEKPQFESQHGENLNFSQGEGIFGRKRWYCCYIDTPDKRIGLYKIVIVLQDSIIKTGFMLFHEFIHIFINLIYGEKEIGNIIHQNYDEIWHKIHLFIVKKHIPKKEK